MIARGPTPGPRLLKVPFGRRRRGPHPSVACSRAESSSAMLRTLAEATTLSYMGMWQRQLPCGMGAPSPARSRAGGALIGRSSGTWKALALAAGAGTGASVGADGMRLSARGRYQLRSPSSFMAAGSSMARTTVASSSTATPSVERLRRRHIDRRERITAGRGAIEHRRVLLGRRKHRRAILTRTIATPQVARPSARVEYRSFESCRGASKSARVSAAVTQTG